VSRPFASAFAVLVSAGLAAAGCGGSDNEAADLFDAQRAFADLEAQVEIGPRPSGSRGSAEEVELIRRELQAAGVKDVGVQRPYANVVGTIPGTEPGAIVVGAHHDTKDGIPGFVGANDGASGVAVVLELARSLEAPVDGPSIHLALFDAEEARGSRPFERDGTRGSRQYVAYAEEGGEQGSPPIGEIEAMVLFDLVGDCDLQIPLEEGSDPDLYASFADAAEEVDSSAEPFTGTAPAVGDDHVPFLEAGIPAVDLIDFAYGPGPSPGGWWHTASDTVDKVCEGSLDAVGEAAMRALPGLP
jgi:Zn-dependent M28 family amino/carboxypeptidase